MLPPDTKGLVDIHPSIWHLFFAARSFVRHSSVSHDRSVPSGQLY